VAIWKEIRVLSPRRKGAEWQWLKITNFHDECAALERIFSLFLKSSRCLIILEIDWPVGCMAFGLNINFGSV
jgi:hypothetical protein